MSEDGDNWEITTDVASFEAVLEAVTGLSIEPSSAAAQ